MLPASREYGRSPPVGVPDTVRCAGVSLSGTAQDGRVHVRRGVFEVTLGFGTRLAVFACVLAVAGAIELYLRTQREYRPWVPNE